MKSNLEVAPTRRFSRDDRSEKQSSSFPPIEFRFQPGGFGGSGGGNSWPPRRPGFNRLAREVLRAHASQSFRIESAILGLVTLAAAWPIAVMIHEVIRFLR
jgi:hypothetical protein